MFLASKMVTLHCCQCCSFSLPSWNIFLHCRSPGERTLWTARRRAFTLSGDKSSAKLACNCKYNIVSGAQRITFHYYSGCVLFKYCSIAQWGQAILMHVYYCHPSLSPRDPAWHVTLCDTAASSHPPTNTDHASPSLLHHYYHWWLAFSLLSILYVPLYCLTISLRFSGCLDLL